MHNFTVLHHRFASLVRRTVLYSGALLLGTLLLHNCTTDSPMRAGDGSSSETVIGMIVDTEGKPAANTQVTLIPDNYNPVTDGALPDSLIDTTGSSGEYAFEISDMLICNIQATHLSDRTRLLLSGIVISEDTTIIQQATLKDVGTVKIIFPRIIANTINTTDGYMIIKGTTFYKSLSKLAQLNDDSYYLHLDSIPATDVPGIHYGITNDPDNPTLFTDTVNVLSNSTTVTEVFVFWANYTKKNTGLPDNRIMDMSIDHDGAVWFATCNGVATLNGEVWNILNSDNTDLPSDTVYEITHDNDGTLWFATREGAASFNGSAWRTYTEANSEIPAAIVRSIAKDGKGNMWFGTEGGGIASYNGLKWSVFNTGNSNLPSEVINHCACDNEDRVWVATDNGIGVFEGSSWTVYDSLNSNVPVNRTLVVIVDSRGNKWFGHTNGSVSRFENQKMTIYDSNNSTVLQGGPVKDIVEGLEGNIVVLTENGLTEFNGIEWNDYIGEKYKLFEGKTKISLIIDDKDNKWVGTLDDGVIAFGPTRKVL